MIIIKKVRIWYQGLFKLQTIVKYRDINVFNTVDGAFLNGKEFQISAPE